MENPMDGLVEQLLRLENSKHTALILIDAAAYDATVREQMRVLSASAESLRKVTNVEKLLELSQLITLNTRLLQNLMATTPLFNAVGAGYAANGRVSLQQTPSRVSVEA
jgi:hypothetical protein